MTRRFPVLVAGGNTGGPAEEAVRRVLVLENPALRGQPATTQSRYAGLHFVIASWHTARFKSERGCVLFSYSDRPVHQALDIHHEEGMS